MSRLGAWPRSRRRPADTGLHRRAATSFALHTALVAALLWRAAAAPPEPAEPANALATVKVEYVNQDNATRGAPATVPTDAAAAATQAAPPAVAAATPGGDIPAGQSSARPAAQPAAHDAAAQAAPAVHLGDSDEDREALNVTGDDVVSSGPDATYRNMPPAYPHDAARHHEQGIVQVLVHVSPGGLADQVELVMSSGSQALDEAATDAVAKWHFTPALRDGMPVPSVYPLQMNFVDREH